MVARLAGSLLFASGVVGITSTPAVAEPPSPLELVRGIREHGEPELALEFLKKVEKGLSPAEAELVPLERARCLLELSLISPKAKTRSRLLSEAKELLADFVKKNPEHSQALEANLMLARLTAIDARTHHSKALGMDIPVEEGPEREQALDMQREELTKARKQFLLAVKQFADVSKQCKVRLEGKMVDPSAKPALARTLLESEFHAAVNEYHLADTYGTYIGPAPPPRDRHLEQARQRFEAVAKGPQTDSLAWVARAWLAEVYADVGKSENSRGEFVAVMSSRRPETEAAKRLARFFQLRREYLEALTEGNLRRLTAVEPQLRAWLAQYATDPRPSEEVTATRFYLAFSLQWQASAAIVRFPKDKKPVVLPDAARKQLEEAAKLYGLVGAWENPFSERASGFQKTVARWLKGDFDPPR